MQSKFLSLDTQDFLKGLVVAVIGSVLTIIETSLQSGSLHFDWKAIGAAAALSGISYLTKNFFSNSNGQVAKTEQK